MRKTVNIQPWLDYFDLLLAYRRRGLLEMQPEKNEAYITQPALHAMTVGDTPIHQSAKAMTDTCLRLQAYAGYLSQQGPEYLLQPFAIHVVKDDGGHDPIYTILLSRKRRWWWPWRKTRHIEVITY